MPFVHVTTFGPTLSDQQIEHLQQGATDLMVSLMRKPIGGTAVFVEAAAGRWSIAGRQVVTAAHVEAVIGLATNTTEEKSKFMEMMMRLLQSVLGADLREETYIVFHESDHDSYGRGGLTRAGRDHRQRA